MQEILRHVKKLSKLIEKEPKVARCVLAYLRHHSASTHLKGRFLPSSSMLEEALIPSVAPHVILHCRTLAALDLSQACREVIDKDANAVLDEVEAAIYLVASTILRGEGFAYDIPSRAKGNQVRSSGLCNFHCLWCLQAALELSA